jgi:transposase
MGDARPVVAARTSNPKGGRPHVPDRAALTGNIFARKSGIPLQMRPYELGCGRGVSCWRRLRDWQQAGEG